MSMPFYIDIIVGTEGNINELKGPYSFFTFSIPPHPTEKPLRAWPRGVVSIRGVVEAGGIEPPSGNAPLMASTGLVHH
ncbi:uncharacterized protein DFE_0989 [Desulfovibrio ferrophilus]|uniref:Uncharacterized protein n=1 Tax=Desulfovibrio ferrophilus TaxID=241368 RepID=A0A2Z6AWY1_9BACT|nr:uncharacterized protein DFE_0989 [Desulfovibrio ferrophilus]